MASQLAQQKNKLQAKAKARECMVGFDCNYQYGLRDGLAKAGKFCIETQLAFALKGDVGRGLFFRVAEPLPLGNAIRPVWELIAYMLASLRTTSVQAASVAQALS